MEFRVLGPLEVGHQEQTLELGGVKQRAVLALLVIHTPEPVSAEQLIDGLWGERPPASALHAVQVYISGIRKVLRGKAGADRKGAGAEGTQDVAPGDNVLVSRGSFGYRLDIDPERVDARRFERLVEEGRRALRSREFEDAERVLGAALGLWRGPALADFLFMEFAGPPAARLEELRVEALEARLDAIVGLGRWEVVGELEALVAENPFREHARWLLMRALYGAGRQADALAVYRDGRRILSEELGLEPGRELRELERAILRQADLSEPRPPTRDEVASELGPSIMRLPLPPGLRVAPPSDYVGRVEEQQSVRRAWNATREGARHGVLISGEPGIGKTEFAFRAARELHSAGALVMYAHCPEALAAPYGPWIQALSPLVEHASDAALTSYVERHGGELTRLIAALGRRMPEAPAPTQTDPESERYLLFSAVVGLLELASSVAAVALVIDDLHWADGTTLALLKHVIEETAELRLLLIGTYRDSDLSRDHPLAAVLADLRRERRIERLGLPGLDENEVLSLMLEAVGGEADETARHLAGEITVETGGNPFFIGEMVRHLAECGVIGDSPVDELEVPRTLGGVGLPQSVREVVRRRVERLGADCRDVLSCASVIGAHFDFDVLARIVDVEEDDLIDLLDAAVEACLLRERPDPSGSFSFAHNLINHALYDGLGTTRRSRVHRRIAEALEALCGEDVRPCIEELAHHWIAATPRDPGRSMVYSKRAGEQALVKLAPDEAARWFTQALALASPAPPEQAERCDLMISLGEAQRQAGRPEFRSILLGAAALAEEMHDGERMARAALANSRGFASTFGAVDDERLAVLERAVELNRHSSPDRCARLLSLQAMEMQFDPDYRRRRALADQALALARKGGDARSLPYVLRDHFHATWAVDTLEARRRTAEEMSHLATGADDPLVRIWALDRTVHVAVESGRLAEARDALAVLRTLTDQLGQPGLRWHATYYAAGLAHLSGDLGEAERLAEAAARLGEQSAEPDMGFIYFGQVCMVRVEQGRADEVIDVLEQAADSNRSVPAYAAAHAVILCDLGRELEAAPMLEEHAARRFADIPRNQVYATALALWAKVAADVGSTAAAESLYDLIEPWRDQFVWNGAMGYGAAEYYLGMLASTLGAHERANDHFATAARLHQREGVKAWQARNLCYWAASQLAAGAPDDAVGTAEGALALARENDFRFSAHRAEALLQLATVAH